MPYIVYENDKYIAQDFSGRFSLTNDITKAKSWFKEGKANNVCREVERAFNGHNFKVKCVSELDLEGVGTSKMMRQTKNDSAKISNKTMQQEHVKEIYPQPVVKANQQTTLDYDILETAKTFCSLILQAKEIKPNIENRIHETELEIMDIEHAAEFYNLNAAQGYRLYKLLHDVRIERRKLKDDLAKINMLLETNISVDDMERLKARIQGLDGRQYMPRINNELFGV